MKHHSMKKQLTFIIIAALAMCGTSCKKIVSTFYKGDDFTLAKMTMTIPAIPLADSTKEFEAGSFTTYFNVDSTIRSHTGGVFGIGAVEYIKVDRVVVSIRNADATNNLSAIKSFRLTISSDSKSAPVNMLNIDIPANAGSSYTEETDGPNIVDYMHGSSFNNAAYGTVRRTTTKSLTLDMVITLKAR